MHLLVTTLTLATCCWTSTEVFTDLDPPYSSLKSFTIPKRSINNKKDVGAGACPFHAGLQYTNDRDTSHPVMGDSVPESWWRAQSFFTPALLQLFDMIDAATSLCSDSPLQRLWIKIHPCRRLHIKLVVRAVFHVETKGPALLLSITLAIHLCWVHQDK